MNNQKDKKKEDQERSEFLRRWDKWFEIPLILLGLCWLILVIVELNLGLSYQLEVLSFVIWMIFIFDFVVRFSVTPDKINYITSQWILIIALIAPAFRVLRGFQLLKARRGIHLLKVAGSSRRGMQILGSVFGRNGLGYILGLTSIIILLGAAGIQALEGAFGNYGEALWWTSMMMTTMGTDFWPQTLEGRILCLGLAIYGFAIFGYITAIVASAIIEKDKIKSGDYKKVLQHLEEIQLDLKKLKDVDK